MRSRVSHIVRAAKLSAFIIAGVLVGVTLVTSPLVHATDNDVNVSVSGSTAASMMIDTPSPVTVTAMPYVVTGSISNLTQIQVYVDGAYSSTIPLTPAATTFSYSLNLNSGTHMVEFIGVSAYSSTNPAVTVTVIYTPPTPPGPSTGGTATTPPSNGGVVIGGEPVEQLDTPGFFSMPMPDWVYKTLVFFDIVNPNQVESTKAMLVRFVLMFIGFFFLLFSRTTLRIYRWVRYRLLHWNNHPVAQTLHAHPLAWIRVVGLTLIAIVLVFL